MNRTCHPLQLPLERLVEDRRHQSVQLSGGFGLQRFDGVDFDLQGIELGEVAALLFDWGMGTRSANTFSFEMFFIVGEVPVAAARI